MGRVDWCEGWAMAKMEGWKGSGQLKFFREFWPKVIEIKMGNRLCKYKNILMCS